MRRIIEIIVLFIVILCSGCYSERALLGGDIRIFEEVKNISLIDSTKIFINSPVLIKNDKERNNLVIQTNSEMQIRKIPKNQVNTIYSRHYSVRSSSGLGWLLLLLPW